MIKNINPIPIYIDHDNFIDSKDLKKIKNLEYQSMPALGNSFSKDLNILDKFPKIKKMFLEKTKIFEEEVIGGLSPAEIYMTQSWVSDTSKNEHHISHRHDNSLFSAVLYISVPEDGCIDFQYRSRLFESFNFFTPFQKVTEYNTSTTKLPVKDGDFIMFPSWLSHSVATNVSSKHRTIIGANFFIRGTIGYDEFPIKLELK